MHPRYPIFAGLFALLLAGNAVAAGNAENGKKLAQQHVCFSCHGQDYKGMATFPPLVGRTPPTSRRSSRRSRVASARRPWPA